MNGNPTVLPEPGQVIDTAAVSLGLPGFVVLAGADYGGELELLIETTGSVTGCPNCGVVATLHDRRPRWIRDLPAGGRPVRLVWFKRVWRCEEMLCSIRTWSETSPAISPRAVLTERARAEVARRVGQDATDVARVAVDLGVSWPTAMRAVRDYGGRMLTAARPADTPVRVLGLDETAFLKATATSHTQYVTGLVDVRPAAGGPARLIDVVEGRSGKVVADWLAERGAAWRAGVQVAAQTRSAATNAPCPLGCPRPPWCWTASTPSAWPSR